MRRAVCLWAMIAMLGFNFLGCGKGSGAPGTGTTSEPKTSENMTPEELKAEQDLVK